MNYLSELLDTRHCHQCGKIITVLYPHLWRYKRIGRQTGYTPFYFCSWGCMREFDEKKKKGEADMERKITEEQKREAVRIALDGGNYVAFLRQCGSLNPSAHWFQIKKKLMTEDPETYEKLAKVVPGRKAPETPERIGGICPPPAEVEIPERITELPDEKIMQIPEFPKPFEYKTTGISTTAGDFQYYRKQGYVDWTPIGDTATVSLKVEEWKELIEHINTIFMVLGVEM